MKDDFTGLSSVARALTVLEEVGLGGSRSLAELVERTALPKSTLMRLLSTLIDLGFLQRTRHGQYSVSLKMWRIGCGAVEQDSIHDAVMPALRAIVERTGETALYAVYEGGYAVYIEKLEGSHPILAYATVGGRSPAYASATGKSLLAWRQPRDIEAVAASAEPLTKATLHGKAIVDECAAARAAGFTVNRGEWREGVWGIAAPVFGRSRDVVAAIGVSGPRERIEPNVESWSRDIRDTARGLSARYGAIERVS
ncbi:MAG: IclR family transcriptional regulator [Vulcanimicrobiaceae bacterium]